MKRIMCVLIAIFILQLYAKSQNVGIGTTQPMARLHVTDSSVLFSAPGNIPSSAHNVPQQGFGRRFLWYPDKAALRAGYTNSNEWDSSNIGKYSIGLGYGNLARGTYSVASGFATLASGNASTATGYNTTATGNYSFAAGYACNAKGNYSFVAGNFTNANGDYSTTLGNLTTANNSYATAMGNQTIASGFASTALGQETNASSDYSTAIGYQTAASGHASLAAGANSKASFYASIALGSYTTASNYASFATGYNTTASGYSATAMGQNTTAAGNYSFVWGSNSNTTGSNSFIFGSNLFDGGHKGDAMLGDTDPWNAGSVGSGSDNQMVCRFSNGYYFLTGGNTNRTGMIANHGDNSWSAISDSSKKEKIIPADGEAFLEKIAVFKLGTWNYKGQDAKAFRHYGPMAQDFHNAFGKDAIGNIGCDTLINQQDFLGVSFIAIQALEKRTEKIEGQQEQISFLQKQNDTLAEKNEMLQEQLQTLMNTVVVLNKKVEEIAATTNKNNPSKALTAKK